MEFRPHSYQEYAIEYIKTHPITALLLDMGLGKTVITLTALKDLILDSFEIHKVLVIAPLRVARDTWPAELEKWPHLTDLSYSVITGDRTERARALKARASIYIINRENIQWLIEKMGAAFDFDCIVIDELSSFKDQSGKRYKALMKVRPKVKRIIGLTGTPTSNGLLDLFAEYKMLDMGERLGRFITTYRTTYFKPDKYNGAIVYSWKPLSWAEEAIFKKIEDITVSMKATDYLDMPELLSLRYEVELDEKERKAYNELKKELVLELDGEAIVASNAAALTGKLSQLSNGALYREDKSYTEIHERKLDALEDIIEAQNGKPLLVAYWYKHDIERIKKRLKGTREIKTSEDISDWNAGKIAVALIHPAAAGHGLNLQQGGNTLVWYGLTWSLELYQQTNARLYRQGQTQKSVILQHIVTKGTVDEQILDALTRKELTQAALIEAVKANIEEVK